MLYLQWSITLKFNIIFPILLLLPSISFAAKDYVGKVSSIRADGGKVLVTMKDGTADTGCGTGNKFWLDPTIDFDKSILSLAITAKATQDTVYILGGGDCQPNWPYYNSHRLSVFELR